ncbi:MAG TPA: efflux RND transporter periplasmic adaptor subunit, partial [Micropepsaceae bacterium]|nr:efflux RND transporter periplasmic adaptor subunit [Micropepsaceae bacterium]
ANKEPKIGYSVARASYGTVIVGVRAPAMLEARDMTEIAVRNGGRLESLAVRSGDRVVKGQRLARLASDSAQAELVAAQAERAARQADLARAEADAAEARAAAQRARGDARPGAADAAGARLARTLANVDEARALLRAGDASLAEARAAVESLDVRAPVDGVVLKINFEPEGDVRSIARGESLLTLAGDLSQMNLRASFPENALGTLRVGERAEFTAPAFPRRIFAATLTGLDLWPKRNVTDGKTTVTYPATLTATNPGDMLRPGMSADVAIVTAEAKHVLVVPNSALSFTPLPKIESKFPLLKTSPEGPRVGRVWVMRSGDLSPRDVVLGLSDGRVTQIVSGPLREGENVVTSAIITAQGNPT